MVKGMGNCHGYEVKVNEGEQGGCAADVESVVAYGFPSPPSAMPGRVAVTSFWMLDLEFEEEREAVEPFAQIYFLRFL